MWWDRIFYDPSVEEEYHQKMRQKSSSSSAFTVGIVAAVGGFMYGYDTGLINDIMAMDYVSEHFASNNGQFTVHERALITAILSLGTFFGALSAPFISDNFGRKTSIIVSSAIIFNIGNILQVSASSSIPLLCVGRGISGLSVGTLSAIVPLYQAEASPKWIRGSIVFTYQWAITWGFVIASAICQGTRKLSNSASYRIPIGFQFLWAAFLWIGMTYLPESPRYYVQKGEIQKALKSLSKLRRVPEDDVDLLEELVEIKANYDYELSFGKTTILDVFRSGGGRHKQALRICTGTGVHFFQQCSGINFIFYYGTNFFVSTGMKNSYLMSFITYAVNMVFTIPGIYLVEVIGRRALLLYGGIGMSVSNLIIAIIGVTISSTSISSTICISFSCVFIAFFAMSWGGCAWALASDLYGISIRQKAIAITAATNWLVNFVFAYITPYLIDTGKHTAALGNKIFFIWGGLNCLGVIFVFFMVYETQGLKLEEVDAMYVNCKNAFESIHYKEKLRQNYASNQDLPVLDNAEKYLSSISGSGREDSENLASSGELTQINMHVGNNPNNQTLIIPKRNDLNDQFHRSNVTHTGNSNFSSQSLSSSEASEPVNDYQRYLSSFYSENDQGGSSFTTASMTKEKSFNTRMNFKEQDLSNDPNLINTDIKKMAIVAVPFYDTPPSDSDSSSSDDADSELSS